MIQPIYQRAKRKTRVVMAGDLAIGGDNPISVQSMCATKTQDMQATLRQIELLSQYGADIIRVAVDTPKDVEALKEIRKHTKSRLSVDLQENYRLAREVAPFVQKIRYNPGHLHHVDKSLSVKEKVDFIVQSAKDFGCAVRIGVNFGSLDPSRKDGRNSCEAALLSVGEHVAYMEDLAFDNFLVSLKSSRPADVVELNKRFADQYPDIPLHLGVTEAGMLPMGEVKTRRAFEPLLDMGIGETLRVSLTLPFELKFQEILVGKKILEDVAAGRFSQFGMEDKSAGLNIVSCPSCSRVENEKFVLLAQQIREISEFAKDEAITIAVMGCRVNGPGETDDADLGLWCAPAHVNLKRNGQLIGAFGYDEILTLVKSELEKLVAEKRLHNKRKGE